MRSIVFLGAPSQKKLEETWKESYIDNDWAPLSQRPNLTAWRQLPSQAEEDLEPAADDSYLVPLNDVEGAAQDATFGQENASVASNLTSFLLTQPVNYCFDPAKVLDLEDLLASPISSNEPGIHESFPIAYTFMAAILSPPVMEQKITKFNTEPIPFVRLMVGDHTASGFEIACWGVYALSIAQECRVRDVLLFQDISLSDFRGRIQAKTRRFKSRISILYRVDAISKQDRRLQPTLLVDAQSRRVQEVRDWVMRWIPKDSGPPSEQTQPLPDTPNTTSDTFNSTRTHLDHSTMHAT
ncbi:hypothetical protein BCR37DRAFT_109593 [Protomyces lactucae-debilis]|uniref:Uncharacterized protein n=1 Tax=Protomyces lactucae-debilis TaxID=2754530 RepID=A0A1Y2F4M8_PROLT|nr:uncharacterized protein BCR37DRAFT_109593 [Protomyces lactucae-debilis]ORY78627.1 hypothetical protein BCR37DRAFT_109593 [Protomyces lactucae-debilis]